MLAENLTTVKAQKNILKMTKYFLIGWCLTKRNKIQFRTSGWWDTNQ